jgi:mono/diheme cytochrome c family protein
VLFRPLTRLLLAALCAVLAAACNNAPLPESARAGRDEAAGRRIYQRKCASCHAVNGDGRTIVAGHFPYANLIDGKWRSDGSPAAIELQIRDGKDPMPKFEGKLTDEEIRQTVAYVLALTRSAEQSDARPPAGAP